MVYKPAVQDSGSVLSLRPPGVGGVDLFTDPAALDPTVLSRAENIRLSRGVLERRRGALKIAKFTNASHTRVFGTDAKYATIPAAAQLLIPVGGWALVMHFTAVRPSPGNTAYILSSRPPSVGWHVLTVFLTDAGLIKVQWRDDGGVTREVITTAVADGAAVHLLAVFDAVTGTYTVYVNGEVSGTPLAGLSATLRPAQNSGVIWAFGVEKETSAAVTANTAFNGAHDGMTLFSLRGMRPSQGTLTLVETLRRHSARAWPLPQADFVLACYDMDEASGTVMTDRSRFKNHGTYVGTPTVGTPLAMNTDICNYIGRHGTTTGARFNVLGSAGRLFYERLAEGV